MAFRTLQFFCLTVTALALIPGGAHLLALPAKMAMGQDEYFVVQSIYRGWNLLGTVLLAAIALNLAQAWRLRGAAGGRVAALAALLLAATLAIFFAWTFPANQATSNWTIVAADWAALRRQWEISHAVNAVLTLAALCCATLAALRSRREKR